MIYTYIYIYIYIYISSSSDYYSYYYYIIVLIFYIIVYYSIHPVSITRSQDFRQGLGCSGIHFFYTINAKTFQGLGPKRRESCNGDRVYSTLFYSTLLYSTLLCSTLLCSALLYSTLLCYSISYYIVGLSLRSKGPARLPLHNN